MEQERLRTVARMAADVIVRTDAETTRNLARSRNPAKCTRDVRRALGARVARKSHHANRLAWPDERQRLRHTRCPLCARLLRWRHPPHPSVSRDALIHAPRTLRLHDRLHDQRPPAVDDSTVCMSAVNPGMRMRLPPPVTRRLLALGAWFAVLVPALARIADTNASLRRVMSGNASLVAMPALRPSLTIVSWILIGTLAATLPVFWTRSITAKRRAWSQSRAQSLLVMPLLAASVVMVVPHGAVTAVALVSLFSATELSRSSRRSADVIALGVTASIGVAAAQGLLLVGLEVSLAYCTVSLACAWLDVARRPILGLRRRWRSRPPSAARSGRLAVGREGTTAAGEGVAHATDAAFRLAARAWRERLAITASTTAEGRTGDFDAALRIHSAVGGRIQERLERILRRCTRRWELRSCEPRERGMTVLHYGVRVPPSARGRLLDAIRRSALAEGVELR